LLSDNFLSFNYFYHISDESENIFLTNTCHIFSSELDNHNRFLQFWECICCVYRLSLLSSAEEIKFVIVNWIWMLSFYFQC